MDAPQVKTFCDTAAQLLKQVSDFAAKEPAQRTPADEALMRQLRVSASAINDALMQLARMTPPPMPMQPPPMQMPGAPPPPPAAPPPRS